MTPGGSAGVVIVGASLGGLRVASTLRRVGYDGPVTLIGDETHLPYDRPPLSKEILTGEKAPADVTFRPIEFFAEQGIDLRLGTRAVSMDAGARIVATDAGDVFPFEYAVIATGARARTIPGMEGVPGVHVMRTLDDAVAIESSFADAGNVVVVGAGFIGSEVASSARARGLDVTIVEVAEEPLAGAVGVPVGEHCAALHERYGADLRLGVGVTAVERVDGDLVVDLTDGSTASCDAAVVGIGVVPNVGWLEGSGVDLDGAVRCDDRLESSVPGVFAVGDVASWHNPLFDRRMRVEHWTNTVEQAAVVARNITGPASSSAYAGVPYFWSDQYGHRLQLAGRTDADEVVFFPMPGEDPEGPHVVALYRKGDTLRGAFALDAVALLMKLRGLVLRRATFDEAVTLVSDEIG